TQKAPGKGLPHQGPTRASTATLGRLQVYTQPLRRPTRSTPAAAINRPPTIAISVLVFVPVTARFSWPDAWVCVPLSKEAGDARSEERRVGKEGRAGGVWERVTEKEEE